MPFPDFDPVLIHIGPLPLRWYALAYVAGILLGWWYAARLLRAERVWAPARPPITLPQLDDLVLWVTLGIILGGRLGYALFYQPSLFLQIFTGPTLGDRLELLQLWTGGMSFHGGFLGVSLAVWWYARKHKVRLLSLADVLAPVAPIGLFFGRIANFVNGELWGRPTDGPFGVIFCNDRIAQLYGGACPPQLLMPRHPSQLYEAALEGLLLFIVLGLAVWKLKLLTKPGYVTGLFLLGYGLSRALMETVREPDAHMPEALQGVITMGMLLSIPMILVGAWLVWRARSRPPVAA
ncbi:MAG TPA: prolipoprotein diacylglyceryl transferase [Brevundimonas sp.]|uniref:prolipoprotein diacylglyceryl transferase n=1 Tax=Brevundimonas sp. TaxID=1871086 RepID=UPI002E11B595|nr:prolipoprotein diacylglyceryl transferase [Brevundimonas sp.]